MFSFAHFAFDNQPGKNMYHFYLYFYNLSIVNIPYFKGVVGVSFSTWHHNESSLKEEEGDGICSWSWYL